MKFKQKLLSSGKSSGVNIYLVEPVLFLRGFRQNQMSEQSTVVLRGSLNLHITKPTKIKAITLTFHGKAVTKWPEGIPPEKVRYQETVTIINHTWSIFNDQLLTAGTRTGPDHIELFDRSPEDDPNHRDTLRSSSNSLSRYLDSARSNRLSRQAKPLWNILKGSSSTETLSTTRATYQIIDPGDYVFDLEFPLDCQLPETIDVESGSVKYELKAIVEREGAFCADLRGSKEVILIRTPTEGSLEQFEPIVIDRRWKDELHINSIVSGRTFPLGALIPISFKVTPLTEVQFHWIKVFATEHIEILCSNGYVHRMEPIRKIQLFEQRLDVPPASTISANLERTAATERFVFNDSAASKLQTEGPMTLPSSPGGDSRFPPTEMEFHVQLPSYHALTDNGKSVRLHCDTTYQNIRVHHWIKILIRFSRLDTPELDKRRCFEIVMHTPFRILSRKVTEATTTLPAYSAS
ncbi:hypothetical protein PMIN04_010937 [Paraphaeosphaeria minitans]|uniref:Arrestin-related trafficking adapter C2D10.04 n=1 Tax=Paraphaeosphaeria minitans TaxID=565426 RepID=A0A9P6GCK7_9PLEO|nr:arrestin-related trafficking adapter C2D10.04 [Paraphaeosphaeria minitans]